MPAGAARGVRGGMTRLLLADPGDLDANAVVPALADRCAAAVVTLTIDVGQQAVTAASRARALAAGAVRAHVIDAREEFARGYLLPLLRAGALRPGDVSRPRTLLQTLVATKLLEVAAMEGTALVAHGWERGTAAADHVARVIARQRPDSVVVAAGGTGPPVRDSRQPAGPRPVSVESTLWWRVGAEREARSTAAARALHSAEPAAVLDVTFTEGVPVALNGVEMPLLELIEAAGTIAGDHGVGRVVLSPPDADGATTTILEAPAAAVLVAAHTALTRLSASPLLQRLRRHVAGRYAALLDAGEWMSDARPALDAFVAETQKRVNGSVRLRLRGGRCTVLGRTLTTAGADTSAARQETSTTGSPAASGAPLGLLVSR